MDASRVSKMGRRPAALQFLNLHTANLLPSEIAYARNLHTRVVPKVFWISSNGKRKQGRPSKRWADELVAVAGPNLKNEAPDRRKWASLTEKAYTQELGELSEVRGGDTSTNR